MLKQKPPHYLFLVFSSALYIALGYDIQRHETVPLLICYFLLFILFLATIHKHTFLTKKELQFLILSSVIYRALLLLSVPPLSDDFYRFIWDGHLLAASYHPFAEVPSFYIDKQLPVSGLDQELFSKLNSKNTFTVYPSVSQFFFWLSVKLSDGSIFGSLFVMRLIILSFEMGTLWILQKLLRSFDLPASNILLYSLNPLVILEVTGNVHFEGVMTFFLMAALLLWTRGQTWASAFAYALSVCTKLVPLLFLPLFVRYLGWKKSITYWMLTGTFTVILFLPLLDLEIIEGLTTGLGYYFQRFEFNASIYYLVREVGYLIFGFNIIAVAGPFMALMATAIILTLSFRNLPTAPPGHADRSLFTLMLWGMLAYLLCTTILHPWYIVTLLAISLFTRYRFPVVWTGFIFLSYAGYTQHGYEENLSLVVLEYVIVIGYLLYETVWRKQQRGF